MTDLLIAAGWVLLGIVVGAVCAALGFRAYQRRRTGGGAAVADLIKGHFRKVPLDQLCLAERQFPYRVRADLQRGIDRLFGSDAKVRHFCGVKRDYAVEGIKLSDCMTPGHYPVVPSPPQYEEIDVGETEPVRCLKNGLWFLEQGNERFVVLYGAAMVYGQTTGVQFQIATANTPAGTAISQNFFRNLEECVLKAESYRGKILSLEAEEGGPSYSGKSAGIKVHKLRTVEREQVILPAKTLELLERNVVQFVRQRAALVRHRQATKKGILFYGPPGTGKTHTIHYLAKALDGHTTLIITAEQVGLLAEYMTLARLLQPSLVVMEDVDLIAKDRQEMGVCEEVMLNKLLNEMDGLNEEADILFILTTNRPESLERALASRPGRVDQAIEFPLPDDVGREKLVQLYSQGMSLGDELVKSVVRRTEKVSAAFIKELMRRTVQFHLEQDGDEQITPRDVEAALDEMLFSGGSLNLKLLGAEGAGRRTEIGFG
jgi:cell division protease FtsH